MSFDLKLQLINKIINTLSLSLFLNMLSAWIKENNTLNKREKLSHCRGKMKTLIREEQIETLIREEQRRWGLTLEI